MKKILIVLPFVILTLAFNACNYDAPISDKPERIDEDKLTEKQFPYEQSFINKNFPATTPDIRAYKIAKEDVRASIEAGNRSDGQWIVQGPGNIGARINTIAVNPTNPLETMVGFASGGVFRTQDFNQNWEPIFDDQIELNIGEITYDPINSNIVYAGTGDPNISGYPKTGSGIFKSTDNGDSWEFKGLAEANIISRIHVSNQDSDILYVSAMGIPFIKTSDRGIYKSSDGGDSWEQKLMINDSTGVIDMMVDPDNHDIIYAAGWNRNRSDFISRIVGPNAQIHKSTDGGETWTILEGGLPQGEQLGRIGLAMSGIDSEHIYASYINTGGSDSCSNGGSQLLGIWESENGGDSWTEINTSIEAGLPCNILGGFGWYFGQIRVNPNDNDDIFILGVDMWRTKNRGESWERAVPLWSTYQVHADKHDLVFDGDRIILATDGGLYHSLDNGEDWIDIENIPTTQFYRVGYNPHTPELYYGGAQDNGTSSGNADGINNWDRLFGGDGFQMAFDPDNPLVRYVETQNGNINVSFNGGQNYESARLGLDFSESTNWDTPYFLSDHDPKILYTGRQSIYRGENKDTLIEWTKISPILTDTNSISPFRAHTISTVDQSPIVEDFLYAGTTDGLVWSSIDGGETWSDISEGVPYRYISDIKASIHRPNTVYAAITGYKSNDNTPYIYKSDDNGQTWEPINGNLPQIAINDILILPDFDDQVLFVATDGGIYFTDDAGSTWDRLGDNMPIIEVYDMVYNPVNDELVGGTFARGIQTFDLSQVGLGSSTSTSDIDPSEIKLYPTTTADRIYVEWEDTPIDNYEITSIDGRIIEQGSVSSNRLEINVSYIPTSMYILTLSGDEGIVSKKFYRQ